MIGKKKNGMECYKGSLQKMIGKEICNGVIYRVSKKWYTRKFLIGNTLKSTHAFWMEPPR